MTTKKNALATTDEAFRYAQLLLTELIDNEPDLSEEQKELVLEKANAEIQALGKKPSTLEAVFILANAVVETKTKLEFTRISNMLNAVSVNFDTYEKLFVKLGLSEDDIKAAREEATDAFVKKYEELTNENKKEA